MDKYSFLNAAHTGYFAQMYDQYLKQPDSVEPSWRAFFQGFDFGVENSQEEHSTEIDAEIPEHLQKEFQVVQLIDGYRKRGHLFTKTNPVRDRRKYSPNLSLENFGLTQADLNVVFNAGEVVGLGPNTLSEIIAHLERVYCDSIGVEYMYIRNPEKLDWIQNRLHINDNHPNFSKEEKKHILKKLNQAVSFENFLHTKYVGQKRFSLEGGESLIPALDAVVEAAADHGVEEFVMGMAHRGRLNTLTNIFGKSSKDIFSEFDGKDYEEVVFDGDVKYHLGWTSKRITDNGKKINMNIAPNPSHLETVGAVVEGITRAKLQNSFNGDTNKVLPIIVHGDAAIAGQGLPYEIVQMAGLKGYGTGGTIHIVVNNQVGFTTNYLDARSSTYCTDVAKVTLSPVLHVNSDDAEAVVHATLFALDYRMKFGRDVFIDLLGYRKYGHNEGDEPRFTQPKLYKSIAKHKNPRDIYAEQLIAQNIITATDVKQLEKEYKESLEVDLEDSRKVEKTIITPFMADEWEGLSLAKEEKMMEAVETKVSENDLSEVAKTITTLPTGKKFLRKIEKLISDRKRMFFESDAMDWAMGELLAYGTLLKEGYDVRISGQDVERGTFSHRHALLKAEESEEEVVLLNSINPENQGNFSIYNSLLSEYAVLGFDYGYAMASPNALTIWEAQFGDFSNGAQIVIDQYIASGEDKWKTQNGIVMLLPHGYEGQGAEHSSARIERYLQLCANDNMFVANCSTPANMFHILRRQMKTDFRKPLIVFTPKSLLRHPDVVSSKKEFTEGAFQTVIEDNEVTPAKAKTLVLCTGKFYYDLVKARRDEGRDDVAIVRIEQLFPLPIEAIREILNQYKDVKDVVWAQEEPRNMGVWSHLLLHLPEAVSFRPVTRRFYAAPAAGSATRSSKRHREVIEYVFDDSKDNFIRNKK
ncbi:2-oxoglutarate dehydrogenase E1 component [Flavobacteriaceae bacterium]|uniref:2-oxoglutarate dehydrogenase E1 component n=1 Tax=Candidatus Arcticimaribacter forsetii TaxID=2820661 RepID=UPI00207732C5|nr:2-oxoglutarate dehydrogenase E1 component [Candidatus Arcticimaribacter forsetii]MDA8699203.1 2-oxoglutarate dehydrogenase E1 component [Flavobacteriaceae bacterium]MDB2329252.1 2-oxoglutarate dehydrogenase E1 component [Flavobacteriaceae bacterium]MDB2346060.1 2-oxoglutarate dehydrogenase E1 component [Flavobacteriaceae bacterium]MDB4738280.1 2-oxoglutarate dehydrogenase E1 component [Flavobacteriaceae bacterium]MDB4751964.1 2-oxoglutarate dehydrogenase E1 component [Flavobacteriaceae bact